MESNVGRIKNNDLFNVLNYIKDSFYRKAEDLFNEADNSNGIQKIGCLRSAKKYLKLAQKFDEYINCFNDLLLAFPIYVKGEALWRDILDEEEIKKSARKALEISSKLYVYNNNYWADGTYNKNGVMLDFNNDYVTFADVLKESDRRIKNCIKERNKRNNNRNSNIEYSSNNSTEKSKMSNVDYVINKLNKLKSDTISHIRVLAVSKGNDSYTVTRTLNDYKYRRDELINELSKKEQKQLQLEEYSVDSIGKEVNPEIMKYMVRHRDSYNLETHHLHDDIIEFLELNTSLMSDEMISSAYKNMVRECNEYGENDTKNLQINFVKLVFNKMRYLDLISEDTEFTYDIAQQICSENLETKPVFDERDFTTKNIKM